METLTVQLTNILNEYDEHVQSVTNASIKRVARDSVNRLKATSPKRKGEYARGWALKNTSRGKSVVSITVYNRTYQLTHLLENGHRTFNKWGGPYKPAGAHKHIEPVEKWANAELPALIERSL